jgi:hypothetical protein
MNRVPVVSYDNKPLMPTKSSRARRWVKQGKAIGKWSDVGIYYIQLINLTGEETQPVVVGVDPGKSYAGIGVQSSLFTLARFHLILPFGRVRQRMEQRRMLRRSRRSRRINRNVVFKSRNHRQVRFNNRKQAKVPPSIKASRQLELRVVRELSKIFPLTAIGYERVKADVDRTSGRKGAKSGKGFSPVMSGQLWAISQMGTIVPVFVREGWQKDGNGTSQIRKQLGLVKDKENKSEAKPETHAVDGVALACGYFVQYTRHITSNTQGYLWKGEVNVTDSVFKIITRFGAVRRGKEYGFFRRQLHFEVPDKSGIRKRKGGTVTPFGFRVGDLVRATKSKEIVVGYIGGFTNTDKSKKVSIYDYSWKRIGQVYTEQSEVIKEK